MPDLTTLSDDQFIRHLEASAARLIPERRFTFRHRPVAGSTSPWQDMAREAARRLRSRGTLPDEFLQRKNTELRARLEACQFAAEGVEVSDFMLSFHEVRAIDYLREKFDAILEALRDQPQQETP